MIQSLWPAGTAPRLQRRLLIVISLAGFAIAGADTLSLRTAHDQALHTAESETSNLSHSLAEQARDVFQTMDVVLIGLRERVQTDGIGPAARQRLQRVMADHLSALPHLHRLLVTDAHGKITVASGMDSVQGDLSDGSCFAHFAAQADETAFLGYPHHDPADGSWVVPVSRRYEKPDGSFAGIVVAEVSTDYFRSAFASLDIGVGGVVLLARTDGHALARWPVDPRGEGVDMSNSDLFRHINTPDSTPVFDAVGQADQVIRLVGYSKLPGWPAILMVGRARQEILFHWYLTVALHLMGLMGVLSIIGLRGHGLARAISEVTTAQAMLLETNERLAASEARTASANRWLALAEQIGGLGHWHLTFGPNPALFWSDEIYRIHGRDPAIFVPRPNEVLNHYHRQDQVEVAACVAAAVVDGVHFEYTARLIRPDGTVRHVLNRGVPQLDDSGNAIGVFGVEVDITEQKQNERALRDAHAKAEAAKQALEAANNQLQTLALQDSLTGLANRRQFDSTLENEFRRATRAASALALIMIDVDMFKPFNDTYGHRAGDSCLRAIADLIPTLLSRPGDTAARYGGEEFAVLLPGTAHDEAQEIALRLAAGVRGLAIAHSASHHGVVTISAGVESFVPIPGQDTPARLVEHADRALYAAKHAGHDKVITYGEAGRLLRRTVRERA
jgi:diguanylate cyclase (GGDEF)-like protein